MTVNAVQTLPMWLEHFSWSLCCPKDHWPPGNAWLIGSRRSANFQKHPIAVTFISQLIETCQFVYLLASKVSLSAFVFFLPLLHCPAKIPPSIAAIAKNTEKNTTVEDLRGRGGGKRQWKFFFVQSTELLIISVLYGFSVYRVQACNSILHAIPTLTPAKLRHIISFLMHGINLGMGANWTRIRELADSQPILLFLSYGINGDQ